MAPLWEERTSDWTLLFEKRTTPHGRPQIYILNVAAVHAKLHNGDKIRSTTKLDKAISTLAATLALPSSHALLKLPKDTTTQTQIILATWHNCIDHDSLPATKPSSYETVTTHPSLKRGITKIRRARHQEYTCMTPVETIHTTYDVLEIHYHEQLNNQTSYLVIQWTPKILTQLQIYTCIRGGFEIKHVHPIDHTDGQPLYEVHTEPGVATRLDDHG